jgi:hypothetical protein
MYVWIYTYIHIHTKSKSSFRLNSEWLIPMILEIEEPIFLFLNRITILVKDFKYNGAVVWNNLPYEVKVAESFCSFNLKELFIRQTLKIGSSCCLYSKSSFFVFVCCII